MMLKTLEMTVNKDSQGTICDILSQRTGLSKQKIKQAMNIGAVWHHPPGRKKRRIRRASAVVKPGAKLYLYYDEKIINTDPPEPSCLKDFGRYSVWFKPSGLLTQGTNFGDHCTLSRLAELFYQGRRKVFIVHRLDREVAGVIILTHNTEAAKQISMLFQSHQIQKNYRAWVKGNISEYGDQGVIDFPIDNKPSISYYKKITYNSERNQSLLDVSIDTGYTHQIRRHLNMIGYPIVGDPRYGAGNKNRQGLQLVAYAIAFRCPFENTPVAVAIEPEGLNI